MAIQGARPKLILEVETPDGIATPVEYQGHGVQRSLMFAALTSAATAGEGPAGTVLLVIEEPEAFQHPLSSRVLARTLLDLAHRGYQVLYSTHSPNFIGAESIGGLRILRRTEDSSGASTDVHELSDIHLFDTWVDVFEGSDFTIETVKGRLQKHLTAHVIEALFANVVVLVEGDEDEALLRASAAARGLDLDGSGVAIVRCGGKSALPNILAFLMAAGVPCLPIFDLDRRSSEPTQPEQSEIQILRALGVAAADGPTPGIHANYACWASNFGDTVADELGPRYSELIVEASAKYGYATSRGKKVARVLEEVLVTASGEGLESQTLGTMGAKLEELAQGLLRSPESPGDVDRESSGSET